MALVRPRCCCFEEVSGVVVEIGVWKLILGKAGFERRAKAVCEVSSYRAWLGQVGWESPGVKWKSWR